MLKQLTLSVSSNISSLPRIFTTHSNKLPQFCGNFDKHEITMASKILVISISLSIEELKTGMISSGVFRKRGTIELRRLSRWMNIDRSTPMLKGGGASGSAGTKANWEAKGLFRPLENRVWKARQRG
ncbi:uncharacterized protein EAE97_010861 [Botrytis byssoidea]|uniref:Uncharacterized protein n=1 Tax=Botrytis byssoidea TaxID=139641 RepID=A0A9P5I524_9HELO|nr:uncharacterized protein EAE97_010861 [Botrytis byssoidea]KAF7923423.1 hypothetical protein EAE97_010861 [Botrytis byssoidea]